MERLTMYIVIRKDLVKEFNWPSGSIIAQACHASTACLFKHNQLPETKQYLSDLSNMHKVVLQIKDESGLKKIEQNLQQLNLPYYTWLEQPENLFTCIATAPILKSQLGDALKKCSLYKI